MSFSWAVGAPVPCLHLLDLSYPPVLIRCLLAAQEQERETPVPSSRLPDPTCRFFPLFPPWRHGPVNDCVTSSFASRIPGTPIDAASRMLSHMRDGVFSGEYGCWSLLSGRSEKKSVCPSLTTCSSDDEDARCQPTGTKLSSLPTNGLPSPFSLSPLEILGRRRNTAKLSTSDNMISRLRDPLGCVRAERPT